MNHLFRSFGQAKTEVAHDVIHMRKCESCGTRVGYYDDGTTPNWVKIILERFPDCDTVFVSSVMDT